MTREEVDLAVEWAANEGWNPGLHDAEAFHATDPGGFLVGVVDGAPVACISVIAYDDGFGFLGFYIVHPEHRGKGYGMALWRAGMARMGTRNVGLDGVVAQQDNYRQSGFVYAYGNVRYEGQGGGRLPDGLVPVADLPREHVHAYDAHCFPTPRERFLDVWLTRPGTTALAVAGTGAIQGYGAVRPVRDGHKIGPLFADSPAIAEQLFEGLRAVAGDGPVYLDVPLPNESAVALAERQGMSPVFETARMYTGGAPAVALDRIFGVTTFELG